MEEITDWSNIFICFQIKITPRANTNMQNVYTIKLEPTKSSGNPAPLFCTVEKRIDNNHSTIRKIISPNDIVSTIDADLYDIPVRDSFSCSIVLKCKYYLNPTIDKSNTYFLNPPFDKTNRYEMVTQLTPETYIDEWREAASDFYYLVIPHCRGKNIKSANF